MAGSNLGMLPRWKLLLVAFVYVLTGVECQNVEVGQLCLEVDYDAEIPCTFDVEPSETLVSVIWRRSSTDATLFPPDGTLVQYHFLDGITIPAEHVGHINITDSFYLRIHRVVDADIVTPRYWCQANVQGITDAQYGDVVPPGIRRATPSSATTDCSVDGSTYTCKPGDKITCSASNFSPSDGFSLNWTCPGGTFSELDLEGPTDGLFSAVRVLTLGDPTESVTCSCSTDGKANCNSGRLTEEITISVQAPPGPQSLAGWAIAVIIIAVLLVLFFIMLVICYNCEGCPLYEWLRDKLGPCFDKLGCKK